MTKNVPTLLKFLSVAMIAGASLAMGQARAADETKPLATAKHPSGLIVEVLEIKMDDTQEKVKITWRYRNPTKKAIVVVKPSGDPKIAVLGKRPVHEYWDGVHYTAGKIDSDKSYFHEVIRTKGRPTKFDATDIWVRGITVPAEGQFEVFAKFGRPENKSVNKIHVHLPEVEQFEDLPLKWTKKDD